MLCNPYCPFARPFSPAVVIQPLSVLYRFLEQFVHWSWWDHIPQSHHIFWCTLVPHTVACCCSSWPGLCYELIQWSSFIRLRNHFTGVSKTNTRPLIAYCFHSRLDWSCDKLRRSYNIFTCLLSQFPLYGSRIPLMIFASNLLVVACSYTDILNSHCNRAL